MSINMARKKSESRLNDTHRRYDDKFKEEAVQMLLDAHTAPSVMQRLGASECEHGVFAALI